MAQTNEFRENLRAARELLEKKRALFTISVLVAIGIFQVVRALLKHSVVLVLADVAIFFVVGPLMSVWISKIALNRSPDKPG
jgi:hypothetical protein